ncbi:hypothetical protein V1460_32770 [Streptomyces sp. SCSIO 30461]|uniref:hypothetical protein n=1 Tax=Streptomyces sp. SCSIO 30461 TaxID=3118085 RepID=UPI0030D23366
MTVVTLMWEARAADGRGTELLDWARASELPGVPPLRRETFRAPGGRVLVLTWWAARPESEALPELPDPAPELISRPVHRWRFESVDFPM